MNAAQIAALYGDPPAAASALPLARLSHHFEEDQYTELLLVFARRMGTTKGTRTWNWEAGTTFLAGFTSWTSQSSARFKATNLMTLDAYAQSLTSNAAVGLVAAGQGYWVLR